MTVNVAFNESKQSIAVNFKENKQKFSASFGEICVIVSDEIPKEYGLITYTQDKIITIT